MTSTLTERYIAATVRTLPPTAQADVHAELAAVIADHIDARVNAGEAHDQAEHAVLTDLGDPDALAATYADRPLHLIGPKYYLTWWRLVKLLWMIVPAVGGAGVLIAELIAQAPVGDIIGSVAAVVVGAFVHVAFWTTVVFAALERAGTDPATPWNVDMLPDPRPTGAGRADLAWTLVFAGVMAAALMWDHMVGLAFLDGWLSVVHPGLWPWVIGGLLLVLGGEVALAMTVYVRRGWSRAAATANTALALAGALLVLIPLARGVLLNPEFTEALTHRAGMDTDAVQVLAIVVGVVVAGVAIWDGVDGWRKAYASR